MQYGMNHHRNKYEKEKHFKKHTLMIIKIVKWGLLIIHMVKKLLIIINLIWMQENVGLSLSVSSHLSIAALLLYVQEIVTQPIILIRTILSN